MNRTKEISFPHGIPIFAQSGIPIYFQLATYMRRQVETGEWPPGAYLPSLEKMAALFGIARLTVRQAIQQLVSEGLLISTRGDGTSVARTVKPRPWYTLQTSLSEMVSQAEGTTIDLLEEQDVEEWPRTNESLIVSSAGYRYMKRIHSREGMPYALVDAYLEQSLYAQAPERFRTQPIVSLFKELGAPIRGGHQVITLGTADVQISEYLKLPLGVPVAFVQRVMHDAQGEILYTANLIYRGDNLRLSIALVP
jgi:GntR family transcriptional regulator